MTKNKKVTMIKAYHLSKNPENKQDVSVRDDKAYYWIVPDCFMRKYEKLGKKFERGTLAVVPTRSSSLAYVVIDEVFKTDDVNLTKGKKYMRQRLRKDIRNQPRFVRAVSNWINKQEENKND